MPDKHYLLEGYPKWLSETWQQYLDIAMSYKKVIEYLLPYHAREEGIYSERDILPILYLIRHFFELVIKGMILKNKNDRSKIVKIKENHNLSKLFDEWKKVDSDLKVDRDVESFIRRLGDLDFKGDTFKYPYDMQENEFFQNIQETIPEITKLSSITILFSKSIYELNNFLRLE